MFRGILLLLFISLLTGCYDKKEIEQKSYVVALGLDKTDEAGKINVTFQIANPEVGTSQSGGGSNEEPAETVSLIANDFYTAKNTANAFVAREISLEHTKVIIVSEELARSKEFIKVIQTVSRSRELKAKVQLIVSKENASTFLRKNKPKLETRPHKFYQFMLTRAQEIGLIPDASIHRFFQITEGDADLFLAIYATTELKEDEKYQNEDEYIAGEITQEGGNTTQFMGSAVFKEGKMIDVLSGEETRLALTFDNTIELKDVLATFPDPLSEKHFIAAKVSRKKESNITIRYIKDRPTKINANVQINLEIIAVPSLIEYAENMKNRQILINSIKEDFEKKSKELIAKSQKMYSSDPFYWSIFVRKYFRDIKDYENADWNKKIYPNADIDVHFQIGIKGFGKMAKDTNLTEVRD